MSIHLVGPASGPDGVFLELPQNTRARAQDFFETMVGAAYHWCVAWHPDHSAGIMRQHSMAYHMNRWIGRRWEFFKFAEPQMMNVTDQIEGLYDELLAGETDPEALRVRWNKTRIVLRDGKLHTQVCEPLMWVRQPNGFNMVVQWTEPAAGIDITGSLDIDILGVFVGSANFYWPTPSPGIMTRKDLQRVGEANG